MSGEKITAINVTGQILPNGDVYIRRRASSGLGGLVVGAVFIALGLWALREGVCFGWAFLVLALLPLAQSGKELQRPDVLIEKSSRRVMQQPRWPSKGTGQSWSLDAFAGVAHYAAIGRPWMQAQRVGLVFSDGKLFPLAQIMPTQQEQIMSMLTTVTGLPKLELKSRWE